MSEDCESLWILYNVFMTPHFLCNVAKVKLTFGWFAHLHLLDCVAHRSKRPVPQELLAHHFSSDHCEGRGGGTTLVSDFEKITANCQIPPGE